MKKLVLAAMFIFAGAMAATAQTQQQAPPQVKFNETEHQFGDIPQGTPVSTVFTFTNEGTTPVTIETAITSCGCTVPEYPKGQAIASGAQSDIKVTYNAAALGNFDKKITVKFVDAAPLILDIKGRVLSKQK